MDRARRAPAIDGKKTRRVSVGLFARVLEGRHASAEQCPADSDARAGPAPVPPPPPPSLQKPTTVPATASGRAHKEGGADGGLPTGHQDQGQCSAPLVATQRELPV